MQSLYKSNNPKSPQKTTTDVKRPQMTSEDANKNDNMFLQK